MEEIEGLFLRLKTSESLSTEWRRVSTWKRDEMKITERRLTETERRIYMETGIIKTNRIGRISNYFDIGKIRDYTIYNKDSD